MNMVQNGNQEKKLKAIRELFDSFDNKQLPGGYAIAVLQEGHVIYKQGFGYANHEYEIPFTTQTLFDFASVAKQFTGFCIGNLLIHGLISIEDDIRNFIPELPDYGKVISIRHLLGHTSGLRDWYLLVKMGGYSEDDTINSDFLMRLICNQKSLNFPPGSHYAYSNSGYFLLAELIHRVTGKSFREYANEKIFGPLRMKSTFFADDPNEIIMGRAFPYRRNANNEYGQGSNRLVAPGCSSLFSNTEDMIVWMRYFDQCHQNNNEILSLMLQPTVLQNGKQINYNFGIAKGNWREYPCIGHGGGWNAFACEVTYFPEERTSIIFLTNRSPNHVNTHDAVRCILFDEPKEEKPTNQQENSPKQEASQLDPITSAGFTGQYYNPEIETIYSIHVKDGALLMRNLVNEDVTLKEVEPGVFKGDTYWCEDIVFTHDSQGIVNGYLLSANSGNLVKDLRFSKLPQNLR